MLQVDEQGDASDGLRVHLKCVSGSNLVVRRRLCLAEIVDVRLLSNLKLNTKREPVETYNNKSSSRSLTRKREVVSFWRWTACGPLLP